MRFSDKVLQGLNQKVWDQTSVNAVIASKAEKRAQKGQYLSVYSLDLNRREGVKEPFNEKNMNAFVDMLYHKVSSTSTTVRLQLMVLVTQAHWTAVDMLVSPHSAQFFVFDAVDNPASNFIFNMFKKLTSNFLNSDESKYYFYRPENIPGTADKKQNIQYDSFNCSLFGLDSLFHLSNLDTFGLLHQQEKKMQDTFSAFKTFPLALSKRGVSADNIPIELAVLFRNTQSSRSFNSIKDQLKTYVINQKGETLQNSVIRNTEQVEIDGVIKKTNQAILNKRSGYVADVEQFISDNNKNSSNLIYERDVLIASQSPAFLTHTLIFKNRVKDYLDVNNDSNPIDSEEFNLLSQ